MSYWARMFVLYLTVLMPLWSSYLVRALAWRQILTREGVLYWALGKVGLDGVLDALIAAPLVGGSSLIASKISLLIVYTYLWLPFMILPLEAALEQIWGATLLMPKGIKGFIRSRILSFGLILAVVIRMWIA